MALQDAHILIQKTCKYSTLHSNFADIIKLGIFKWEIILDYSSRPNVITKVLIKKRQQCQSQRRCDDIIVEAEVRGQSGSKP